MPERVLDLLDWLAEASLRTETATLFGQLCERIRALGVPLERAAIQLDNLHPLYFGYCLHWYAGQPGAEVPRSHEFGQSADFQDSPYMAALREGGRFRWRRASEPRPGKPLLRELRTKGYTDYLTVVLPNGTALPPGVAWATRAPTGFTEPDAYLLSRLSPHLAAPFGLVAERRKLAAVLRTYLGEAPAQAVAQGRVRRGDLVTIDAVVLLTDLRGFSTLAASGTREALIDRLGAYAEAVVEAIASEGGDVLKFIGDGILAIFPITPSAGPADRARAALAAVRAARRSEGSTFTAVLHTGPVAFGNVGARERLDFTVIGEAVNVASRLETVAKELGVPTVASGAVGRMLDEGRPLGQHRLKGIAEPVDVVALEA